MQHHVCTTEEYLYTNKHICPEYEKGETKGNSTKGQQFRYLLSLYILSAMFFSFIVFMLLM